MSFVKNNILCVDVGRGTQDVLYYCGEDNFENCTSLIVPSRTSVLSNNVQMCISEGKTPLFTGYNMGGFSVWRLCSEHIKNGGKIYAETESAKTFHDNPQYLRECGVSVIDSAFAAELRKRDDIVEFITQDVMLEDLENTFRAFDAPLPIAGIAVSVQDHGEVSYGQSNRVLRFQNIKKILETKPKLLDFTYWANEVPSHLTRMQSVVKALPDNIPLLLTDTGISAILGCLEDPAVSAVENKIVLNVGNGHTVAAYLKGEHVIGYLEHHTSSLSAEKIMSLLHKFAHGELDFESVFNDGGHGAYTSEELKNISSPECLVAVTGPNRSILSSQDVLFSSPHGNMMLSGSYGLLRAFLKRIEDYK